MIIGIDTNRIPIPPLVSEPPMHSVQADSAALNAGCEIPPANEVRGEAREVVNLSPSRSNKKYLAKRRISRAAIQ
jgi:hypothetical protein